MTGFGKDSKGQILYQTESQALGALASRTLSKFGTYSLVDDFRLLKSEIFCYVEGASDADDDVILFGICDAALSAAEIEECLESEPNDANDPLLEKTHRAVWPLGLLVPSGDPTIRQSMPTPLVWDKRWTFSNPDGWSFWAYNLGGGALTTGSTLNMLCKHYGVWVR